MRAAGKSLFIFKQNWLFCLIACSTFILGAGLGVLTANNLPSGQLTEIHNYLGAFLQQIEHLPFDSVRAVRSIMYENIILIGIIYFLGLTFVGIPLILGLVLGRGFLLGFAVSCLTKAMSWPGLVLAVVSLLPHNLFYLPALIIGVTAAISFAALTYRRQKQYRVQLWRAFAGYTAVMLAVAAVTLGAALIEAYFSPWLTRLASGLIQTAFPTN